MSESSPAPLSSMEIPGVVPLILTHLVSVIENADASDEPFSHLYAENCFPKEVYSRMLSLLPDPADYSPLNLKVWRREDGTSTRDRFFLTEDHLARLPDDRRWLWRAVTEAVCHPALKKAVFRQLATDIATRFEISRDEVEELHAFQSPRLLRDVEDYTIKPHPDGLQTIVTLQFYLPADLTQEKLGTSIYRRNTYFGSVRSGRKFDEVKRFPFRPNSAQAFAVINTRERQSWHGVELLNTGAGVRHSLLVRFRVSEEGLEDY